jgi:proline racemase
MCGHAVIALGRFALDQGLVAPRAPTTRIGIECPCGLVEAWASIEDGRAGAVAFDSVPAFAAALDVAVEVPGHGRVVLDVAYGGAYYALRAIAARPSDRNTHDAWDERAWQAAQLPDHLRTEIMDRIVIEESGPGLRISIRKGAGF